MKKRDGIAYCPDCSDSLERCSTLNSAGWILLESFCIPDKDKWNYFYCLGCDKIYKLILSEILL